VVDGRPVVFEINPRFGGSLSLDVTAYLDAYLASLKRPSMRLQCRFALARFAKAT
jgi:carbamoylphosphate synthase large subunit